MTKALLLAVTVCFGVTGANACNYQRSVQADQAGVDTTIVASVAVPQSEPVTVTKDADASETQTTIPAK